MCSNHTESVYVLCCTRTTFIKNSTLPCFVNSFLMLWTKCYSNSTYPYPPVTVLRCRHLLSCQRTSSVWVVKIHNPTRTRMLESLYSCSSCWPVCNINIQHLLFPSVLKYQLLHITFLIYFASCIVDSYDSSSIGMYAHLFCIWIRTSFFD